MIEASRAYPGQAATEEDERFKVKIRFIILQCDRLGGLKGSRKKSRN